MRRPFPITIPAVLVAFFAIGAAGATGRVAAQAAEGGELQELGRLLFWDPILSGSRDASCATCHHPDFAYADGRDISLGAGSTGLGPERMSAGTIAPVPRNSPTILNVAFNGLGDRRRRGRRGADFGLLPTDLEDVNQARAPMFWDNRVRSLEAQALEPIKVREELRGDAYPEDVAVDSVVARLRAIPEYARLFEEAFGDGTLIEAEHLGRAIAAFERTLLARNSPFDRFLAGDRAALTAEQIRGMDAFDDAECTECHSGPMLSDFDLHAEGVAEHSALASPDVGDGRFRFRTPSLRNVALTAPYMHNGVLETLEDVLAFYDEGDSENPHVVERRGRRGGGDGQERAEGPIGRLDRDFQRVDDMSEEEMTDIIAFLESLSDPDFDTTIPARVPSGLPPGGAIR